MFPLFWGINEVSTVPSLPNPRPNSKLGLIKSPLYVQFAKPKSHCSDQIPPLRLTRFGEETPPELASVVVRPRAKSAGDEEERKAVGRKDELLPRAHMLSVIATALTDGRSTWYVGLDALRGGSEIKVGRVRRDVELACAKLVVVAIDADAEDDPVEVDCDDAEIVKMLRKMINVKMVDIDTWSPRGLSGGRVCRRSRWRVRCRNRAGEISGDMIKVTSELDAICASSGP
jgi:hypothetical protein